MATMEQQFAEAQEKALKAVEQEISSLFEGKETIDFRFDAFSMWGHGSPKFWKDFPVASLHTDDWYRAVWSLNKADALAIAKHVELWNADWEHSIARNYDDVDPDEYYNAYSVSFSPASGREHQISVSTGGRYTTDSWQWS